MKTHIPVRPGFQTVLFTVLFFVTSCHTTSYQVASVKGECITIDSTWDQKDQSAATQLLAPYKQRVHEEMYSELGHAAISMDRARPESPLSNLVAEVLRRSAKAYIGKDADMGLINVGGIRNSLSEGVITRANLFELLPFENSLCILKLDGQTLTRLCGEICRRGGEGISGIRIKSTREGRLISAELNGRPIEPDKTYHIATVDYLAEGNDGLRACRDAQERICPDGITLRELFIQYVKDEAAAGRAISAETDGRFEIK